MGAERRGDGMGFQVSYEAYKERGELITKYHKATNYLLHHLLNIELSLFNEDKTVRSHPAFKIAQISINKIREDFQKNILP